MAEKHEFRPTTDTDSDSSLWGDSDDEWYDVPNGEFMSPQMMALHLRLNITVNTDCDSDHESDDDDIEDADLVDIPASALGSSAEFIAFVRSIPPPPLTAAPTMTPRPHGRRVVRTPPHSPGPIDVSREIPPKAASVF